MKKLFLSVCAVASILSVGVASANQGMSKEVSINVSDVFVPGGFSSETDAYVVVSGMYPNSCYKWARADVSQAGPMVHEIRSIATVSQTMCLMVLVPYSKEVRLGRLESGDHTLRFLNGDGTYFEKTLTVE
jgi:hypothetical protein